MEKKSVGERLRKARLSTGLNQGGFADKLGLPQSSISKIENGSQPLSDPTAMLIEYSFGIRRVWLLTGEGEMFSKKTGDSLSGAGSWKGQEELNVKDVHSDKTDYLLFLKGTGMYTIGDTIRNVMERGDALDLEEMRQSKELFMETVIRISRRVDARVALQKKAL